ncbi:MAG: DUF2779 domain-containing protein [Planctomycetota bacterium]
MTRVSKSSFLKGRQCLRRLWLAAHGVEEPAIEADEVWDMREAEGAEVERCAERLFDAHIRIADAPDEELALESRSDVATHVARTIEALREQRPIFQAHFAKDDLLAIADIVEPKAGGWYVWEVKSSTEHKPVFDWDLAFQLEVARLAGIKIVGSGVIRLNAEYVRAGDVDAKRLLVLDDRTADVSRLKKRVRKAIAAQREALARDEVPVEIPGNRCKAYRDDQEGLRPSACGHLEPNGYCGKQLPPHWAGRLPRLAGSKAKHVSSTPSVEDIDPDDVLLEWTPAQQRMIRAVKTGVAQVDRDALRDALSKLSWPVAYVDFEFDSGMAIPRFDGTWPYARLPFQWSMQIQRAPEASLERLTPFLHLGSDDPRQPFLDSLLRALPSIGSIVVHSRAAEQTVLDQLARAFGADAQRAVRAIRDRMFDTRQLLESGYYHPAQNGSYSLKKVSPALVGRGYQGLAVQNGMAAVVAWKGACALSPGSTRRTAIEKDLLDYCDRDTELMHSILEAIRKLVAERGA